MFHKKTDHLSWLYLSALITILDHLSKMGAVYWLMGRSYATPILPHLNFILAHNSGAAFSFLGGEGTWQRWLFVTISLGVSIYLVRLLALGELKQESACWGVALIIGGALGNLYDRLTLGYVIDFIDVYVAHWHFATFNLADSAISVGAFLWIFSSYQFGKK